MDVQELIELPDGTGVIFDDSLRPDGSTAHAYYLRKEDGSRGRRLTSVTTTLKGVDPPGDGLLKWAAKMNGTGIARLINEAMACDNVEEMREALAWATNEESIWSTLKDSKLTWWDIRAAAGTRGTNVHELALEALATGKPTPDYSEMTPLEKALTHSVVDWWQDHELTADLCLDVEQIVCSPSLNVAGRFDLRVLLDGEPVIVDLKTGKYVGIGAHVQLAAYDYLARACGVGASAAQYILHVTPDGYEFIKCVGEHEDFLTAVDLYRRSARLGRDARKAAA